MSANTHETEELKTEVKKLKEEQNDNTLNLGNTFNLLEAVL